MSKADQFRQYAEEAMRWARQAKTEKEKQGHLEQCSILTPDWAQVLVGSCFRLSSRFLFPPTAPVGTLQTTPPSYAAASRSSVTRRRML
jgi:hypothetical protein